MKRTKMIVRIPRTQLAAVEAIAKLAGVSTNDAICVLLAYATIRMKMETDKEPLPGMPR